MVSRIIRNIVVVLAIVCMTTANCQAEIINTPKKTIRIAVSNTESLLLDRIIYTAFNNLGYNVAFTSIGMNSAITSVETGECDVLGAQVDGLSKLYPDLTQVPVAISSTRMTIFARTGFDKTIKTWDDLSGLRVAFSNRSNYVPRNIPADVKNSFARSTQAEIFADVQNGTADVAVLSVLELVKPSLPDGIVQVSEIEKLDTFSYVNKYNANLVPLLTKEYKKLLEDGTIAKLKSENPKPSSNVKTVLHISSYNTDMLWEHTLVQGLADVLGDKDTLTYYFQLNLKRLTSRDAQFELMCNQIRSNFLTRNPDVVVVSDNDALNFITRYYNRLFKWTPVVFCGVNSFSTDMIAGFEDKITGAVEIITSSETVDEILRVYPKTKNIFVLNDFTTGGLIWQQSIQDSLSSYTNKVNVVYNKDVSFEETLEDIKSYGDNTIVLTGSYFRDAKGRFIDEKTLNQSLDSISKRPVFALLGTEVGSGALGGKVSDPYKQGYVAGTLAMQVLNGVPVSELPIVFDQDKLNTWEYDYKVAADYKLNPSTFHTGHTAINKEIPIYVSNPHEFVLAVSLLLMLVIIIISLLYFMRRQLAAKKRIEYIAMHDSLTKLKNRAAFEFEMKSQFEKNKSGYAMLLDIDNFKGINDVYGHAVGDLCLIEFAKRLSEIHQDEESIFRVGGDEFFMIAPDDLQKVNTIAENIINLVQFPFKLNQLNLHIKTSIGISRFPQDGNSMESVLKNADLALYSAKNMGKNQNCFFSHEMAEKVLREEMIQNALRNFKYSSDIYLVYQPEIDILTGEVYAVEALLRLNIPALGQVKPSEFISIAENSRVIIPLGLDVLEKACLFGQKLIVNGKKLYKISVNLSPIQLDQESIVHDVANILEKTGLAPTHLQLEITEGILINNEERNIHRLNALRDMGISIALDDFGSGFSSMKYLTLLPLDTLKIDKSFIDAIETDEKKNEIALLIINTAHTLGLRIVAEGIETQSQISLLRKMGCDIAQGYLYSKPLTEDELEIFLG